MSRELVWARNQVPWPETSLLLAPPDRTRFPSTKPWPSPTLGRKPGPTQPGTQPWHPLLSLLLASPFKSSHHCPLHTSSPPRHLGLHFWQLSRCPQPRTPCCPGLSRTRTPLGTRTPPGTPRGARASQGIAGRDHGVQQGTLRAHNAAEPGLPCDDRGCYGNGGFLTKRGINSF